MLRALRILHSPRYASRLTRDKFKAPRQLPAHPAWIPDTHTEYFDAEPYFAEDIS